MIIGIFHFINYGSETSLPPHYIMLFEIPLILPRSSVPNVIIQVTAQEMSIQVGNVSKK